MLSSLYRPDAACLKQLSETEPRIVYNSILAELAAWEQRDYRDCDEIPRLADTLNRVGYRELQPLLEDWLGENPSPERFEVVGWFLWSYWMAVKVLDVQLVHRFISATADLATNVVALHAVLFALTSAAKHRSSKLCPMIRNKLADIRLHALKYKLEPGILGHLEDL